MLREGKGKSAEQKTTKRWHRWVMEMPTEPKSAPPTLREYLIHRCKDERATQSDMWSIATTRVQPPLDPKPYMGKQMTQAGVRRDPIPTAPKHAVEVYVNTKGHKAGPIGEKRTQTGWMPPEPPCRPVPTVRTIGEPLHAYPIQAYPIFGLTPLTGATQPQKPQLQPQAVPQGTPKRPREEVMKKKKKRSEEMDEADDEESEESSTTVQAKRGKKKKHEVWLQVGKKQVKATYRA